jgi:diguanylate cyclase (GGDEF)-like protein
MTFAFTSVHLWGKDYDAIVWWLLALQFLVYPHLVFWRAKRASDPLKAELNNLILDSLLIGLWVAVLEFPLWITFTLFISTSLNHAISRGRRGILLAIAAFSCGALTWIAIAGFRLSPQTNWLVTLLCILGLSVYLLAIGAIAFARNRKLRETREKLQLDEKALHAANETLRRQLDEIHLLQEQLREQANRDPLTGLYNRRYLGGTLEREMARSKREGQPLSLMLIDIDHFKKVNDSYGHLAGDEVIKRLAGMLCENARAEDVACRYGGEAFLLLQPKMSLSIARERAEQWRTAFSAMIVPFGEFRIQTTLSIGLAAYPGHGKSSEELIESADRALYLAKSEGRNRVRIFAAALPDDTGKPGGDPTAREPGSVT